MGNCTPDQKLACSMFCAMCTVSKLTTRFWKIIYASYSKLSKELKNCNNPNTIKSYKILQKLSPKHAAHGVAQSPYPIYRHGKACLSKQPPWCAAPDPRLARGRSRVRAPNPAGALRALFFSTLPSFLLRVIVFRTFPTKPTKVLGLF